MVTRCVYLDGCIEQTAHCRLHRNVARCESCGDRLELGDPEIASRWIDPLVVVDRHGRQTDCLRGLLAGVAVFLIGGGPSFNSLPLAELRRRGVWSMAINNAAGHAEVRPQAMICADPPSKFSYSIWADPGVMKFVPIPKLAGGRSRLRIKRNGVFAPAPRTVAECPNVWGFKRQSFLWPDERFFLTDAAPWGNHDAGVRLTGEKKTVCTMLCALRLLFYLGARRVYLLGVDFRMTEDRGYSFSQARDADACRSNNAQYAVVNEWLCRMQAAGVFDRFGIAVRNCNEHSGLTAFPHVPFDVALADVRGDCEETPDLTGWYEK